MMIFLYIPVATKASFSENFLSLWNVCMCEFGPCGKQNRFSFGLIKIYLSLGIALNLREKSHEPRGFSIS